jgi:hypothetical protein
MQVHQPTDFDTHVIIGGGKARAFTIAATAEFFTVLSKTLYSDEKLAVVREVLCNAWDAHIMIGRTDLAIEIELTETSLVIRDFGPGIHDDKIDDTYCKYGGTTKLADEKQTGGFGLGCKAPFAYSDHFTVESNHQGVKHVYGISRGSSETDGAPDLRVMVKVPTTDVGLAVTIPVLNKEDMKYFAKQISRIVREGSIRAKYKGADTELPRWDYEPYRKQGFIFHDAGTNNIENYTSKIYVLNGTVLYPIGGTSEEIIDLLKDSYSWLPTNGRLIVLAEPGTIGVTPSREALSYTDSTIETVKALVNNAKAKIIAASEPAIKNVIATKVATIKDTYHQNFDTSSGFKNIKRISFQTDPVAIATIALEEQYAKMFPLKKRWPRLRKPLMRKFKDARRYIRRTKNPTEFYYGVKIDPFTKYNNRLMIRLLSKMNLLKEAISIKNDYSFKIKKLKHRGTLDCANNILYLGPNQRSIEGMFLKDNDIKAHDGYTKAAYGIIITKALENKVDEIKKLAIHYGITIKEAPKLPPAVKENLGIKSRGKRGHMYSWADVIQKKVRPDYSEKTIDTIGNPTLTTADAYIRVAGKPDELDIHSGYTSVQKTLYKLFPKIAIVFNTYHEEMMKSRQIPSIQDALLKKLLTIELDPQAQFAACGEQRELFEDDTYIFRHTSDKVKHLIRYDKRYGKFFFGDKFFKEEVTEEIHDIVNACNSIITVYYPRTVVSTHNLSNILNRMATNFKKTQPKVSIKEIEEKFPYLSVIQIDTGKMDMIWDMIHYLKQRHEYMTLMATPKETKP